MKFWLRKRRNYWELRDTNLEESITDNKTIIDRYHELYKIEQAFRVSKNDLQTRPIFHFKEEPIKLHILICFMALVISKHIELKTGISIRKFIHESKKIIDGEMLNHITQKIVTCKAQPIPKMKEIIAKLELPHEKGQVRRKSGLKVLAYSN